MKLGLKPVVYEAGRSAAGCARSRSRAPTASSPSSAAMRFPVSSTAFYHYVGLVGLETRPFPNPLTPATPSHRDRPRGRDASMSRRRRTCRRSSARSRRPGTRRSSRAPASPPCRRRSATATPPACKEIWNALVPIWDERTFYDFVATSAAFASRRFRHREVFGQVGFGTGGWDTDFPNSMLEILRVVVTDCDEDQRLIVGGVEQLPRRLWRARRERMAHWPAGTTLDSAARRRRRAPASPRIAPRRRRPLRGHATAGATPASYAAVLATCQSWLLTTRIDTDESAVLARAVDGARPHPLHAVVQDLRHGRPAVLEGPRPRHRPLP